MKKAKQEEFTFARDYRSMSLVGAIKHAAKIRKRWYAKQMAQSKSDKGGKQ